MPVVARRLPPPNQPQLKIMRQLYFVAVMLEAVGGCGQLHSADKQSDVLIGTIGVVV